MTPEEQSFLDQLRRALADKIAPLAAETDETAQFVHRQLATLAALGLMGANLPAPYGPDIAASALYAVVEAVAGACGSTASALTAHYLATDSLLLGGDAALQARFLPDAAAGDKLGAFALTERNAGSDPADMRTTANRQGDHYRLKGSKCFISNGGVADFVIVYAVTDPATGHRGISAFVVEKGTQGLTYGRVERTMGLRGGHVWELEFDCLIPQENRLGPEGTGFKTAMKVLDNGRIEVAAMATGIADTALKLAQDWCKTRIIGGRRCRTAKVFAGNWPIWPPTLPPPARWPPKRLRCDKRGRAARCKLRWRNCLRQKWCTASPMRRCNCTAVTALPATFPLNVLPAIAGFSASTKAFPKSSA